MPSRSAQRYEWYWTAGGVRDRTGPDNRLVRAGSARHQEPLVLGGHERSTSANQHRRSEAVHHLDLERRSSPTLGSNPSVPQRLRDSVPTATATATGTDRCGLRQAAASRAPRPQTPTNDSERRNQSLKTGGPTRTRTPPVEILVTGAAGAYGGPATLMVDSPWPARTTRRSAHSVEGLLSRWTAPLGT